MDDVFDETSTESETASSTEVEILHYRDQIKENVKFIRNWQSRNYVKLWNTEWPEPNARNLEASIATFQAHYIEFDMSKFWPAHYNEKLDRMDQKIPGTNLTPDFVWVDKSKRVQVVEYKIVETPLDFSDQAVLDKKINLRKIEIMKQYSASNVDVIPRILVTNNEYFSKYAHSQLLIKMWDVIQYIKRMDPKTALNLLAKDYTSHTSIGLNENIAEVLIDELNEVYPDLSNHFEEVEMYVEDYIAFLPRAEAFMNYNYLPTEEMANSIPTIQKEQLTISSKHPWNETENRKQFEEVNNVKIPKKSKAFKSNYILHAPFMYEIHRIEPKEFDMLSELSGIKSWSQISQVEKMYNETITEQSALDELTQMLAIAKGEAGPEAIEKLAEELSSDGPINPDRKSVITEIFNRISMILLSVESKLGASSVKLTKHGKFLFSKTNELFKNAHVNYKNKKDDEDESTQTDIHPNVGFTESFTIVDEDMKKIEAIDDYHRCKFDIPNFKDAYIYVNSNMNDWSNKVVDEGINLINPITEILGFNITYFQQKWKGTLMASLCRVKTKLFKDYEVSLVRDTYTGLTTLGTAAVSEQLSGALIIYGKVKPFSGSLDMSWIGPLKWYKTEDWFYFISKPFRLNWQESLSCDMHLYGSLAVAVASRGYQTDLWKSNLFWSLFFNFSRQLKFALDIVYLYMKSAFCNSSFGRDDLDGKFNIIPRDVRLSTIICRLKENHAEFSKKAFMSTSSSKYNQLVGIIDPIFPEVKHTGWNSLLLIVYLKQCLTKDDGCDPTKLLGEFFNSDMEYDTWWDSSKCNSSIYDSKNKINLYKFFMDYVLKKDENGEYTKWEKISYHPGLCYRMSQLFYQSAIRDNTSHHFRKDWKDASVNTAVNSSVMISDKVGLLYGVPAEYTNDLMYTRYKETNKQTRDDQKRKQPYNGLLSTKLTVALIYEEKMIKERCLELKQLNRMLSPNPFRREFELPKTFLINDRQLDLWEMALLQSMIYPKASLLMLLLKYERNYAKRPFFMQMVYGRNFNRICDTIAQAALKSRFNRSDLIMLPGMQKNIKIYERMEGLGVNLGNMAISEDMTKFMDTYSNKSIKLQDVAARDCGIISMSEHVFLQYIIEIMENKAVLVPHQYRDKIEEIKEHLSRSNVSHKYINAEKYVIQLEEGPAKMMLANNSVRAILNTTELLSDAGNNPMGVKREGLVLGTFNKKTSVYSGSHINLNKMTEKELFVVEVSTGNTHSDDVDYHTKLPNVETWLFKESRLQELMNLRYKSVSSIIEAGYYEYKNGFVYLRFAETVERTQYTLADYQNWESFINNVDYKQSIILDKMVEKMKRYKKYKGKFQQGSEFITIKYSDGTLFKTDIPNMYLSKLFLIMVLFGPRAFSQRPSLLKVNTGSASEMLQQIHASNLNIYIPLMRYFSTILANLAGKSLASDLNSAVGRAYDMVVNRCPVNITAAMMILINIGVGERFGIPADKRNIHYLPENWGLYWTLPDKLLTYGFSANIARILAGSSSSINKDSDLSRMIQIMMHTDYIWKTKKKSEAETQVKEMLEDTNIGTPDNIDMNYSAPETFKDFVITWNRLKRTSIEFSKLLEVTKDKLKEASGGITDPKEAFESIRDQLGPLVSVNSRSSIHKIVSVLSKMKTRDYSTTSVRASPDTGFVGRFGYHNRTFSNPFSLFVNDYLLQRGIPLGALVTISKIQEIVILLSKDMMFPIHQLHKGTYFQLCSTYAEPIRELLNHVMVGKPVLRTVISYEDEKSQYIKITPKRFLTFDTRLMVFACALLMDRWKHPEKVELSRWPYIINPTLVGNNKFDEHVSEVKKLCLTLGITTSEELDRHARLIVSLFSPLAFHGVVNLPYGAYKEYNYFVKSYTFNQYIDVEYSELQMNNNELFAVKTAQVADADVVERPILLSLWNAYSLGKRNLNSLQLFNRSVELKWNLDKAIELLIQDFNWSPRWASKLFTLMLYDSNFNKVNIQLFHGVTSKFGTKYKFTYLKYKSWPGILMLNEFGLQYPDWSVYFESNKNTSDPADSREYYLTVMCYFISYCCYGNKLAMTDLGKLKRIQKDAANVFKVFNVKQLLYQDFPAPDTFPVVDINLWTKSQNELLKYFNIKKETECENIIVGFKSYGYIITPWRVSTQTSGLSTIMKFKANKELKLDDNRLIFANRQRPGLFTQRIVNVDPPVKDARFEQFSARKYVELWKHGVLTEVSQTQINTDSLSDNETTAIQCEIVCGERVLGFSYDLVYNYLFGVFKEVIPSNIRKMTTEKVQEELLIAGKRGSMFSIIDPSLQTLANISDLNELGKLRLKTISSMASIISEVEEYYQKTENTLPTWAGKLIIVLGDSSVNEDDFKTVKQINRRFKFKVQYFTDTDKDIYYLAVEAGVPVGRMTELMQNVYIGEEDIEDQFKITQLTESDESTIKHFNWLRIKYKDLISKFIGNESSKIVDQIIDKNAGVNLDELMYELNTFRLYKSRSRITNQNINTEVLFAIIDTSAYISHYSSLIMQTPIESIFAKYITYLNQDYRPKSMFSEILVSVVREYLLYEKNYQSKSVIKLLELLDTVI